MRRIGLAVAAATLSIGLAACQQAVDGLLEQTIRDNLQQAGIDIQNLDCSSSAQGGEQKQAQVTCSGTSGGQPASAVATVRGTGQAQLVVTVGGQEVLNRTVGITG